MAPLPITPNDPIPISILQGLRDPRSKSDHASEWLPREGPSR
jgi:hypothetical protein